MRKQRITFERRRAVARQTQSRERRGVIVDLRRNGGGSLEEMSKLTGLFIGTARWCRSPGRAGNRSWTMMDPRIQYDGPLIVLNSRFSASASEILRRVAGLQPRADRRRPSTHGKRHGATAQSIAHVDFWRHHENNPGTLKITKAKFYAPAANPQLKGVPSGGHRAAVRN